MCEVYLHLWCCLKFLQDMTILHSFCSLSMVMALLCVTIIESLLSSQQSYIVSLFSRLISILCKNWAVIRKMLPSLWPLLPLRPHLPSLGEKAHLSTGGKKTGKGALPVPIHGITSSVALRMTENGLTLVGISLCPTVLCPARNGRKMLPVPRSLLQLSLKTDSNSQMISSALTSWWLRVVSAIN